MSQVASFQSGSHLCDALEELVDINKRELPFVLDRGCISHIRLETFSKERTRIRDGLAQVEVYQAQNGLFKDAQKTMADHPSLANEQLSEDFKRIGMSLEIKISQMAYILLELSKFIDQYLLDEKASILNETEKESLYEAYVAPYDKLLREIITSFRTYGEVIEVICQNLFNIKMQTALNLKEYSTAASDTRNKSMAISAELVSASILGFLGREAAGKAVAAFFVGGGVIGGVLIAVFFVHSIHKLRQAIKKNGETLNRSKIDGIQDLKSAEEEMKKMEEFVTKLVDDLEKNKETLKKICSEDESENFNLVEQIVKAMDDKIKGKNLSAQERDELLEKMDAAEHNLERFKQCL